MSSVTSYPSLELVVSLVSFWFEHKLFPQVLSQLVRKYSKMIPVFDEGDPSFNNMYKSGKHFNSLKLAHEIYSRNSIYSREPIYNGMSLNIEIAWFSRKKSRFCFGFCEGVRGYLERSALIYSNLNGRGCGGRRVRLSTKIYSNIPVWFIRDGLSVSIFENNWDDLIIGGIDRFKMKDIIVLCRVDNCHYQIWHKNSLIVEFYYEWELFIEFSGYNYEVNLY